MNAALHVVPVFPAVLDSAALAGLMVRRFRDYNEALGDLTRRAAAHFNQRDWHAAQADAVARIELYELHVGRCVAELSSALAAHHDNPDIWAEAKEHYEALIARLPDSD